MKLGPLWSISREHKKTRRRVGNEVDDYATDDEELKTALTKWGAGKTRFQM